MMKKALIPVRILFTTALLLMGCGNDDNQNENGDQTDLSENASISQSEKIDDKKESS